jgi:hypothetical protein
MQMNQSLQHALHRCRCVALAEGWVSEDLLCQRRPGQEFEDLEDMLVVFESIHQPADVWVVYASEVCDLLFHKLGNGTFCFRTVLMILCELLALALPLKKLLSVGPLNLPDVSPFSVPVCTFASQSTTYFSGSDSFGSA